jgi:hypothetical protein
MINREWGIKSSFPIHNKILKKRKDYKMSIRTPYDQCIRDGVDKKILREGIEEKNRRKEAGKRDTQQAVKDAANYLAGQVRGRVSVVKDSSCIPIVNICYECINNHFYNEEEYTKYCKGLDVICDTCKEHSKFKKKEK